MALRDLSDIGRIGFIGHERELLDFCVLFPTTGLAFPGFANDELRQVVCRALNLYVAEIYSPYAHRVTPAATIPMHTPEEAITELEFASQTLGLKTAMIASYVRRPELMTDEDFRDFTFANPVRFFAGMNPEFFKGTAVESAVAGLQG